MYIKSLWKWMHLNIKVFVVTVSLDININFIFLHLQLNSMHMTMKDYLEFMIFAAKDLRNNIHVDYTYAYAKLIT